VTEDRKKEGKYYIHNITSINTEYFPVFVAFLDAIFRYHHKLPKPAGEEYFLKTPPQTDLDERAAGQSQLPTAQMPAQATQSMSMQSSVAPQSQLAATTRPGGAPVMGNPMMATQMKPGMMNPQMNSQMMGNPMMATQMKMNPQMMGMNSQMMGMNPQMMSMNPQMMSMNPQMMSMMQQNPQMMSMMQNPQMMTMLQQNPQMMQTMLLQQQQMMMNMNPQLRNQLMATQMPGNTPLGQTQMKPPDVMAPAPAQPQSPTTTIPPSFTPPTAGQQQIQQEKRMSTHLTPDEEEEEFVLKNKPKQEKKMEPFHLDVMKITDDDEATTEVVEKAQVCEWTRCPVRLIPLSKQNEEVAESLLASHSGKDIIDFGESFMRDYPEAGYNLDFGYTGQQVPVEQELKQKIILVTNESQKFSFKICKRRHLKYRFNAEPLEGTLGRGQPAIEIQLTLKMGCTTSVQLEVPILFWHGGSKDYDKAVETGLAEGKVFVTYLRGKMQSQLSTRLDIEEVLLYKPAIGNGAFGTVYKGRYRGLDVACKLLKDQDNLTTDMFNDFRSEVRMFELFRHPCIVNFIGAVFFPGSLALVTELCQYGALPSAMKRYGPKVWTPQMKIKAMYDCARAMDFLHQSSIIHRDLKPDNLLCTSLEVHSPAVCKLSDFGTTKGSNSMMAEMKMTKGIGTPLFMAPEMMRGTQGYTTKADVYSFGIMMASVTDDGKEPYEGDPRIQSSWQFTNLVIQGLRPNVQKESEMPAAFINLMKRCWADSPDVRPCFTQIVSELEAMLSTDEE